MKRDPGRLNHAVPGWVERGSVYHIRIRVTKGWGGALVEAGVGEALLASVAFYEDVAN